MDSDSMDSGRAGGPSSDLFEQLDAMAAAEPLDPEDDLVLRMQSSARVQGGERNRFGRDRQKTERSSSFAPRKGIGGGIGKRKQPKRQIVDDMKIDGRGGPSSRPSAAAVAVATAIGRTSRSSKLQGIPLKRSHSI